MKNLELVQCVHQESIPVNLGVPCCITVDSDTGCVYVGTDTGLVALDGETHSILCSVSLRETAYLCEDDTSHLVGIQFLQDQDSVCAATSSGDVILWNILTQELECVGTVASGLTCMAWSPNQDLVLLTTGEEKMVMMTSDFNPIFETNIHQEEFGEAEFITAGWGKKETQFHGSEGKQAAFQKTETVSPALPWDDMLPRVSWCRDDFVVSSVSPVDGARRLRMWNRECVLQATSETVSMLGQALCWKPSGSLIASTQRKPHRHEVVFFEKNGLRHGEFVLPFGKDEMKVLELLWNSDSTVLAVWLEELCSGEKQADTPSTYVQLWTVSNYHWYLKQSLSFGKDLADKPTAVVWDAEHANRLHVVCHGGRYVMYEWSWVINRTDGWTAQDKSYVAVIDGDKVLLTPFRQLVIPPPMSAYSLQLSTAVNQVLFSPAPGVNDLAAVLTDGTVVFYTLNSQQPELPPDTSVCMNAAGGTGFQPTVCMHVQQRRVRLECFMSEEKYRCPQTLHHFVWLADAELLTVGWDVTSSTSVLYHLGTQEEQATLIHKMPVGGRVYQLCRSCDGQTVAIELTDGTVLRYHMDRIAGCPVLEPWRSQTGQPVRFPVLCSQLGLCTMAGQETVLGLTDRFRFFVNGDEISSNCTSFAVHDDHLLLTTHAHTCTCLPLHMGSKDLSSATDEKVRRVERGSRLVTVVPQDTKVILQMPRGNLETVHPRTLVLGQVQKLIGSHEFLEAFLIMRKHRVNLNLLCDLNPQMFLTCVPELVTQLKDVNYLNLFLTELREEDVTETMYSEYLSSAGENSWDLHSHSKMDQVCDAVKKTLEDLDCEKYLLGILTCHIKKAQPELEVCLQRIQEIWDNPPQSDEGVSAEEALNYVLLLVDVNELFNVALGTYDLRLVLMVAEKSQKDPKEYLPFLKKLQNMEENLQRYTIDLHLKRYHKAAQHLSKCGPDRFADLLALVKEHKLYKSVLQLYTTESKEYKDISEAYGEYLLKKGHVEEAGLVLSRCEEWEKALQAFEQCCNWRQALCVASRLQYSTQQTAQLALRMAGFLRNNSRQGEAAVLLEQYVQDEEGAIITLLEGNQWEEALRVINKYNRTDIIDTNFKPALLEASQRQLAFLQDNKALFTRHKDRLAVVRKEKAKACTEILGEDHADQDVDLYSDTSSTTRTHSSHSSAKYSGTSKTSGRTAKSRRKAERKKLSLREGSPYEDHALLVALKDIVDAVDKSKDDVHNLLKMLVLFGFDCEAGVLQACLEGTLSLMDSCTAEIWQTGGGSPQTQMTLGPHSTVNSILASMNAGPQPVDPVVAVPPPAKLKDSKWKLSILEGT
ncbi:PREDICTED: elongator complex protein 1-like [Branchiostoma belcheri]|uniref:Elongator complex protein 1 n=1 Tax=Branchiostoma belcheri TaxID=7741 RepID=A0A6P4YZM6_BRABE|nr:PREDICTED: elongator complex protein 1-like [Branchiostoma belcheri]